MRLGRRPSDLSGFVLAAICGLGVLAFGYPFLLSERLPGGSELAHATSAPLIFALLGPSLLTLLVIELSAGRLSARSLAILGMLAAVVAALRIPAGPGDTPTFFFIIILAGYVYGARFGFLLGALGLAASALITGGVGPWMPFQMFVCGWMGMSAGWLGRLPIAKSGWGELLLLAGFGYLWGLLFGAMMNLWFWPFAPPSELSWQPGMGLGETLRCYAIFYGITSLAWDAARGLGNVIFIIALGKPILKELRRFQRRFQVIYQPK